MELKVRQLKTTYSPPSLPVIYFQLEKNQDYSDFVKLEGEILDGYILSLKKPKKKSLTANNYMWQLCEKIAQRTRMTKEEVYKHAVRQVGVWNDISTIPEALEPLLTGWERNGIGWFGETVYSGNGQVIVRLYSGSSVYDGDQMRRLIDFVVDAAEELKITTLTPKEIERLKSLWGEKVT
jgi:hypothetical protein